MGATEFYSTCELAEGKYVPFWKYPNPVKMGARGGVSKARYSFINWRFTTDV